MLLLLFQLHMCGANAAGEIIFKREKKAKVAVNETLLIAKYNANMGGVHRMNQNISKYRTAMRRKNPAISTK